MLRQQTERVHVWRLKCYTVELHDLPDIPWASALFININPR